ncbi:MAG: serine/threonine-protein kinase [Planctomycetota bacterium]
MAAPNPSSADDSARADDDVTAPASSLGVPVGRSTPNSGTDPAAATPAELSEADATYVSEGALVAPGNAYAGLKPKDLGKALVGQMIDSVLLEEFVGGGGMGAVFRARDVALKRTVAVKVLATHNSSGGDVTRRFEIEAQSAARLDHPNIARIYHVGEERGLQYIVFEFVDGQNLRDTVADLGPQPVRRALSYAIQLTDALAHAWSRQVVHRDIKPSNILVTNAGQAKLVDMGLARLHQSEAHDQHDLTATGATLGTFDYIAPEQARDPREADIRSDIYSLGCTLYFLLVGRPPFPDGTALQKLLQHQADQPPDIRTERPDVPRGLARVLERMLAKRPASRHADPVELMRDLLALAQPMGLAASGSAVVTAATGGGQRGWRRHAPWVASLALLPVLGWVLPGLLAPPAPATSFQPLRTTPATPPALAVDPSEPPASGPGVGGRSGEEASPIAPEDRVYEQRGDDA